MRTCKCWPSRMFGRCNGRGAGWSERKVIRRVDSPYMKLRQIYKVTEIDWGADCPAWWHGVINTGEDDLGQQMCLNALKTVGLRADQSLTGPHAGRLYQGHDRFVSRLFWHPPRSWRETVEWRRAALSNSHYFVGVHFNKWDSDGIAAKKPRLSP